MKKTIFSLLLTLVICVTVLQLCTLLLVPKHMTSTREGALIAEYYKESTSHDIIFLGDCEIYESIVPPVLWEEYGMTSFVRGSPAQSISQSYYLLEETFEYESPTVVVFNVYAARYDGSQREEYNRLTLDGMKNSKHKHSAIMSSLTEGESIMSYYFPILRYHSRWSELSSDDFKYMFYKDRVSHNGYLMQTGIYPMTSTHAEQRETAQNSVYDPALPESSFDYLDKMKELCNAHGAELLLIKSPTNSAKYWWYDEWDIQIKEYAEKNKLTYYNFIDSDIDIDWQTDTYDGGIHLNVYGAEKFTSCLGDILLRYHGLDSHKNDHEISRVWNDKLDLYYKEKEENK